MTLRLGRARAMVGCEMASEGTGLAGVDLCDRWIFRGFVTGLLGGDRIDVWAAETNGGGDSRGGTGHVGGVSRR